MRYKTDFPKLFARLDDVQEDEVRDWMLVNTPWRPRQAIVKEERKVQRRTPTYKISGLGSNYTPRELKARFG